MLTQGSGLIVEHLGGGAEPPWRTRYPDPSDRVDLDECRTMVRESLSTLPEHLRSVITLVYYQGFKYREAADVLAIPVGTVKSRMHSALQKLNEIWQDTPGLE